MASFVTKLILKKFMGESAANKEGKESPYFESVPATQLNGGRKVRRRKKAAPPGLSPHDVEILTKVKRRAYRLDCKFSIFGIRFGYSSLIAAVPFLGDAFDVLMALMVVRTCCEVEGGLPMDIKFRMYFSIFVDFLIGLVPILGDIGDAAYKANTKNAIRLEKHLREKGKKNLRSSNLPVPETDPSDPRIFEEYQANSPSDYTGGSLTPEETKTVTTTSPTTTASATTTTSPTSMRQSRSPRLPQRTAQPDRRSWFGFGRANQRQTDEEM